MALALETVVKQLADSGIIAPGKLENFVPPKATPKDGEALLRELHKQGLLTTFQAQQVAANKIRSLILGAYTLIDRIGAGGMGQVFKAQHRKMERIVAIKMLPKAMLEDAAAAARFQREVVAAAKLSHPNIVAAYDAAEANGVHFLVMEYVEGQDLSALVKKDGPLPVGKAVNYVLQAARGLEFAHGKGVIHRDIKPANLLLGKDGTVKILDMGLARIEGDAADHQLTSSGTIMGTVDFMAPEQAISTRNADARADIYSLGISLYYLLSARPAYGGETAIEKLMAHQTQPIPSLQDVQTTVPKGLDDVFRKMVAKKMEDRYQSMSEVIEALEELGIGAATTRKREVASTLALSPDQKKKLAAEAKKKPLSSLTEKVASEKTKHLVAKIVGGAFATIIAPILVTYLLRYLEKKDEPPKPPAAASETLLPVGEGGRRPDEGRRSSETDLASSQDPHPSPLPKKEGAGTGSTAPPLAKAPFDAGQAKAHQAAWAKYLGTQVETTNSAGMRMTLIPPGEFLMGSTPEQVAVAKKMGEDDKMPPTDIYFGRLAEEMPQHKVTIGQPFLMGSTEVTVAQFRKFVEASKYETEAEKYGFGNSGDKAIDKAKEADKGKNWKNPGYPTTDETAVTQITWNDACAYCAWLSEQEQHRPWYRSDGKGSWLIAAHADGYRLPTEAEWEYACRAGTTTQYSFGDDKSQLEQHGWFSKNAGGRAQPVALKLPNPFGLFDIHGNAVEWCQDRNDGKWYEKSSPTDPNGPSSGSNRVVRGGYWYVYASFCRSAYRFSGTPSVRHNYYSFRCVRVWDDSKPEAAVATTAKPSASATNPTKPWETPEFQKWVADTQKLSAEQQIEAVSKKLVELNPGFDGKVTRTIEKDVVTAFGFVTDKVTDITPVRAFVGLRGLNCRGSNPGESALSDLKPLEGMALTSLGFAMTQVSDLAPLSRMRLTNLNCSWTKVDDLSPLRGMPLTELHCDRTQVSDLAPLQGMPLTDLSCEHIPISDLAPLQGMNLKNLNCYGTPVSDLSVLRGMPLKTLTLQNTKVSDLSPLEQCRSLKTLLIANTKVSPASVAALQKTLPNCKIEWDQPIAGGVMPTTEKLAYLDPAFQQWVKATGALPAEQQIEAVSKKLMELNPGFDGVVTDNAAKGTPKIENGVVTELGFVTDNVTDISPVRALEGLKALKCVGSNPDKKGKLVDLSPLEGMRLTTLSCFYTQISDLAPLRGMKLSHLFCGGTQISDLTPLAGMPLKTLYFESTPVSDLSPLQGMELTDIRFTPKNITIGLDTIRAMKSLKTIQVKAREPITPAEFWKKYDAGEFGKPVAPAKLAYLDPAFQQWVADTQALPAEKQIEAVSKKLMELNPGFDGKMTGKDWKGDPKIENGVITELNFYTDDVADISPVRALVGLKVLMCGGSFDKQWTLLSDLSPLRGMQLSTLYFPYTSMSDISPLEGMPLTHLTCNNTLVTDIAPLRGMPLTYLICNGTQVSDLSPLQECKTLKDLGVKKTKVTPAAVAALQKALPNCKIEWDDPAKAVSTQPNQPWNTPASQAWMKEVQAMPAEEQIEAVSKKLMELNPGFDGKVTGPYGTGTPRIENGVLTEFGVVTEKVNDISPIRALLGLKILSCSVPSGRKGMLSDLSPLQGMGIEKLMCIGTGVADLSPLRGMALTSLNCGFTQVSDLSPLQGMPMERLSCYNTNVSSLSPLVGMPLRFLTCSGTAVSDLKPLKGLPLTELTIPLTLVSDLSPLLDCKSLALLNVAKAKVTPASVAALQKALPNCKVEWDDPNKAAATQPNQPWDTPAFQQWVKATQTLPAEKQIETVSKKLMELNPGFDGKLGSGSTSDRITGAPKVENGVVTELVFVTDKVTDISPVRVLSGLKVLKCHGSDFKGVLTDISPLQGMQVTTLDLTGNRNLTDISPLKDMPLTDLILWATNCSDLVPLKGMRLTTLNLRGIRTLKDLTPLQGMPLAVLDCVEAPLTDLTPLQGMKLTSLQIAKTKITDLSALRGMPLDHLEAGFMPISDLSPLSGMPLTRLDLTKCPNVSDLSPLEACKNLKVLNFKANKVTPAGVAALQKALPNCKIEWDDPTKSTAPQPAASGTK